MLKITRKFDYAMVLLTELGRRRRAPSSARRISERYGLSLSLTASVLKGLQRSAIVRSIRGVHGGYLLGRDPKDISLGTVMAAMDGGRSMAACRAPENGRESRCPAYSICPVRGYIEFLERRIQALFDGATLADVLATGSAGHRSPSQAPVLAGKRARHTGSQVEDLDR